MKAGERNYEMHEALWQPIENINKQLINRLSIWINLNLIRSYLADQFEFDFFSNLCVAFFYRFCLQRRMKTEKLQ